MVRASQCRSVCVQPVIDDLIIQPQCPDWHQLIADSKSLGSQALLDRTLADWQHESREALGLSVDTPIVATGHQTLLWHPGILVKYLAVNAFSRSASLSTANLIVDQHADGFGEFSMPLRRADGSLAVRRVELTVPRPGVPMGLHEPFDPPALPTRLNAASDSVQRGCQRIVAAVGAHRDSPNAAMQMAHALADLMHSWVAPLTNVCATDLMHTTLARALLRLMADDPHRCARHYNDAVRAMPEAGVGPLLVRDDYVEVPLWRIRSDGSRMRAYDNDIQNWLAGDDITLMPRALFMTALIRLVMCDLFIHGTGGANYDRAMERWIRDWLSVQVNPIAVVTATLRLSLMDRASMPAADVETARHAYRHAWHDPVSGDGSAPSVTKQSLLDAIKRERFGSLARRRAFFEMHSQLESQRQEQSRRISQHREQLDRAVRAARDSEITRRRDWPFPLYPKELISELASAVEQRLACPADA